MDQDYLNFIHHSFLSLIQLITQQSLLFVKYHRHFHFQASFEHLSLFFYAFIHILLQTLKLMVILLVCVFSYKLQSFTYAFKASTRRLLMSFFCLIQFSKLKPQILKNSNYL